jgi:hypothetical protein
LPVWIDDVFICDASVEGLVAFRRLLEANHLGIDDFRDRQSVSEPASAAGQHRRRAGMEGVGLGPAETKRQAEIAMFGCLLLLDFDAAGLEINNASVGIGSHLKSPLGVAVCVVSTRQVRVDDREQWS